MQSAIEREIAVNQKQQELLLSQERLSSRERVCSSCSIPILVERRGTETTDVDLLVRLLTY